MTSEVLGPDTDNSSAASVPSSTDSGAAVKVRVRGDEGENVLQDLIWKNVNAHRITGSIFNVTRWLVPGIIFGLRYGT